MSETSQSVMRAVALTVLTAGFAGVWQNDRPEGPSVASYLPADQRTFLLVREELEPTPAPADAEPTADLAEGARQRFRPEVSKPVRLPQYATQTLSRSISLDLTELMISRQELSRHLMQLPLGLAAGDYRIVDSQGGVGWLRVSGEMVSLGESEVEPVLTTDVEGQTVRFIRIGPPSYNVVSRRNENLR